MLVIYTVLSLKSIDTFENLKTF